MSTVHDVAQRGFGEGTNDLYDRVRPSYPPAALSHIHASLPSSAHTAGLNIIEAGSGTGIFTRLLISPPAPDTHTFKDETYPTWNISKLYSVEPSSGMRGQWEKGLEKLDAKTYEGKEIRTVEGGFDDFSKTGIEKGEADMIVIAQAYHWCPDHEQAFREFGKYLKPDGILVLLWNLESRQHPFSASVLAMLPDYDQGTPQYYRMWWRKAFETEAYKSLFGEEDHSEKTFGWSTPITDQTYTDRMLSKSFMTEQVINGEERVKMLERLKKLLADGEQYKEYIDKEEGIYKLEYTTDVVILRRKA